MRGKRCTNGALGHGTNADIQETQDTIPLWRNSGKAGVCRNIRKREIIHWVAFSWYCFLHMEKCTVPGIDY